jgi:hypothetical protein
MNRLGSVPHLLAVNDVRVRIERACRDLGWSLARWDRPEVGKLRAYTDLYRSGRYEKTFGTRPSRAGGLHPRTACCRRGAGGGRSPRRRNASGLGRARFATLDEIRTRSPLECLTEPTWRAPGAPLPLALFSDPRALDAYSSGMNR